MIIYIYVHPITFPLYSHHSWTKSPVVSVKSNSTIFFLDSHWNPYRVSIFLEAIKYHSNTIKSHQVSFKYHQKPSNTRQIPSNTRQIPIKYPSNTDQIPIKYPSNTHQIPIKYPSHNLCFCVHPKAPLLPFAVPFRIEAGRPTRPTQRWLSLRITGDFFSIFFINDDM